jgi:hypothetical protein
VRATGTVESLTISSGSMITSQTEWSLGGQGNTRHAIVTQVRAAESARRRDAGHPRDRSLVRRQTTVSGPRSLTVLHIGGGEAAAPAAP